MIQHPQKGQCLVATRQIKPLEIILNEKPAVLGPYSRPRQHQCLDCFKIIKNIKGRDRKGFFIFTHQWEFVAKFKTSVLNFGHFITKHPNTLKSKVVIGFCLFNVCNNEVLLSSNLSFLTENQQTSNCTLKICCFCSFFLTLFTSLSSS